MTPVLASRLRLAFAVLLAVWGFALLRTGLTDMDDAGILHNVSLPIHETGHLVFAPFGEVMQLLGGSLFQILVPLIFVGAFARKRDWFGACVCLWWMAYNCWDVSIYVGDARARELPLLGGDPDNHDWFNLLGIWDRLDKDTLYAARLRGVGTLLFLGSIGGGLVTALRAPAQEISSEQGTRTSDGVTRQ